MQAIITIIAAIFVFALVIFIHEFGHFLFAKLFGVRVNEFAIGMGPTLVKKQGKETLYSIRAVPIGGYCAMEGENESSDDPNAFGNKKVWQRVIIVCGGAVFNVILGFILYLIIIGVNPTITTPGIEAFTPNSALQAAGAQKGDQIVKINDTDVNIYEDISFFMTRAKGNPILVTLDRGNKEVTLTVTPTKVTETYQYMKDKVIYTMKQNGKVISTQTITDQKTLKGVTDKIGQTESASRYMLGFDPADVKTTFSSLICSAFYNTLFICKLVYTSLFELVTGQIPISQVSGPVGIIGSISTAAKYGFITLLRFLAMIKINLGVFNLLPIPALDGGRLVFLIYEGIARKPVPPKKEGLVHMIGFIVLIGFIIFVSFSDILKLLPH